MIKWCHFSKHSGRKQLRWSKWRCGTRILTWCLKFDELNQRINNLLNLWTEHSEIHNGVPAYWERVCGKQTNDGWVNCHHIWRRCRSIGGINLVNFCRAQYWVIRAINLIVYKMTPSGGTNRISQWRHYLRLIFSSRSIYYCKFGDLSSNIHLHTLTPSLIEHPSFRSSST